MEINSFNFFVLFVVAALAGLAITETGRAWLKGIVTVVGAAKDSIGHSAARGDLLRVKELIASGTPLDERDGLGRTALHRAAENGHVALLEYLLAQGADVNLQTKQRETPLFFSILGGHEEAARKLLDCGADPNLPAMGISPLAAAIKGVWLSSTRLVPGEKWGTALALLEHGATASAPAAGGDTHLHTIAKAEALPTIESIMLLKKLGGDTGVYAERIRVVLAVARKLIAAGADVDALDSHGLAPLHYATRDGRIELIEALVQSGANVHLKSAGQVSQRTPAEWSAVSSAKKHPDVHQKILDLLGNPTA